MKPTIRNKLLAGFCGVLLLMAVVAGIGAYAVFSLRSSAQAATSIGGRLNSIALELQVHNLEADRRVRNYLLQVKIIGEQKAREMYLEEANFEIHEIHSLAEKAVSLAPTAEVRTKFARIVEGVTQYEQALGRAVEEGVKGTGGPDAEKAMKLYEEAAERLHERAEDGEVTGRDASRLSLEEIDRTSSRSVALVVAMSLLGLALGITLSYKLSRAILDPVNHLKNVAENVSLGNLDIAVRRYSEDEIGDLADSFSRMVTAVKFFRMEAEDSQAAARDAAPDNAAV